MAWDIRQGRPGQKSKFGRYEDLEFIGEGAVAEVYRAIDPLLHRRVALKFIRRDAHVRPQAMMAEARAQAQIAHPNICKVYEIGESEGSQFIAMQYIDGVSLDQIREELTLPKMVWLFQQIAEAVHAAHSVGIIHRDLKPRNIMVEKTKEGDLIPYVMDFGLAREISAPGVSKTGEIMGTPWYMSPEQARGEIRTLDRRSDVFSLGATFYEILTGKVPFDASSALDVLLRVTEQDPVPVRKMNPAVPEDLQTIVMKCLEKDRDRRYDSTKALAEDLRRFLADEPILARRASLTYRVGKKVRKHPMMSGLFGFALLLIIILGTLAVRTAIRSHIRETMMEQFSQQLKEVEAVMRFAHMIPLHNVESEKNMIRTRLVEAEQALQKSGGIAMGPGYYALGRGYIALHDFPQAKMHLEKAWNEYDYRDPQTAYVLALTYAVLFQQELRKAEIEERKAPVAALQSQYRDPALRYIKEGRGIRVEAADYVEAWVAFAEKKYRFGLQKAELVFKNLPWLYEAPVLQAEIYTAMAEEEKAKGNTRDAGDLYRKAEGRYEAALKLSASDSNVYEGYCFLQTKLMELQRSENPTMASQAHQKAIQSCENAIKAAPDNANAARLISRLKLLHF